MLVRSAPDVASYITRVEPWLLRNEAEHNLLLGLLPALRAGDHAYEPPIYLAWIEDDGDVVGCAFRTPPFKLGLTRMPTAALDPLVAHVATVYGELPAVLGPEAEAVGFAERWSRRTGCSSAPGMRQRIHAAEHVVFPEPGASGGLRLAHGGDVALLVAWLDAFASDTGTAHVDSSRKIDELMRGDALFLWEDDGTPRSMVAASGWTRHGARVGYVYTPPPWRGRGYATSAVAECSDRLLRAGRRSCFLYTDLANPTSNAIYARIGYVPVCDVVDVEFTR